MSAAGYGYNVAAGRYVDLRTGQFVPKATVNAALKASVKASADATRALYSQLQAGQLSIAQWQVATAKEIKTAHLATQALQVGGWQNMTPGDYGRVGGRLRQQYAYLDRFAAAYAAGDPNATGGRGLARAGMYGNAARTTYYESERQLMRDAGKTQERRVLHSQDTCTSCVAYAGRGWVAIGTLPPVGQQSECRTNCKCEFQYR